VTTPTMLDLAEPRTFLDGPPQDFFTWLRTNDPVCWIDSPAAPPGFWAVTKYHDVIAIERDVATFSSARPTALIEPESAGAGTDLMMLNQDPPEHTRLRMLVARGFTPKVMKELEPHVREAASRIVGEAARKDEADFVLDFAAELPLVVIAELLGVPYEDRGKIFDWSNRLVGNSDPEYAPASEEETYEAAMELFAYAQSLADKRRQRPLDDIVTTLVSAELEGEKLSEVEFNVFFLLLSVAGNETTRNLISGGMLALMRHPDQQRLLVEQPELIPTAVDEMLRYVTPVMYFRRTVTRDTELRGKHIAAGDAVTLWYGSANRDEDVFEDPQTFDVTRTPNEHIAFGGRGPHYCLGASLAKMEIRLMFEQILSRLPDMELAAEPEQLCSNLINGIKHMRVRYTPERE
jgi:cholest-4-en-3-one 26-monooxygenase